MGRQSQDVVVRFVGDTGNLAKGADQVSGRLQTVSTSLQGIATAGLAVGAISFFSNAISEARDAARVTRQTEQVIRSTGGAANVTAGQIGELSEALSDKAAVDDEVIQHGANLLATFTKVRNEVGDGNDIFDQATGAALDMSAALSETGDSGADMQASVTRLGKALNDPIKGVSALAKVGVTFTEQQKTTIKTLVEQGDVMGAQKVILAELKTEFGGMAEASADSAGKAAVSWGNFAEDVGTKVMPAVNAVSNWALRTGLPVLGDIADTVGDVVTPAFNGMVDAGGAVVSMWQDLPAPIQNSAIALGAWALVGDRVEGFFGRTTGPMKTFGQDVQTVMTASQGSVGRFGASMQVLQDRVPTIGAMGAAFRGARGDAAGFGGTVRGVAAGALTGLRAAGSGLVGFLGGPWGIALIGATALITIFANRSRAAEERQRRLADAGKRVAEVMAEQNGELDENVRKAAAKEAEDRGMLAAAESLGISTQAVTSALLGEGTAYESVTDELRRFLAEQIGAADVDEFRAAQAYLLLNGLDNLNGAIDTGYAALQRQNRAAQESATGMGALATATTTAIPSSEQFKAVIESTGVEFDEAADFGKQLADAIRAITGEQMTAVEAEEAYHASIDALTESIRVNGATLDIRTEKGRANRDAVEAAALAIRDQTLADIESGVPMDQALKRHNDRINALRNETTKTFGAKSAADGLITTYGDIPKEVVTAYKTKGYEETMARLRNLSSSQYLLETGKPITPANLRAVQQDRKYRYADGGFVDGPGTTTSDSIPAWLSRKEFVNQASSVDYYGPSFFHALNQRKIPREMLPGFAKGGMVWPFPVTTHKTKIPDPMAVAMAMAGRVGGGAGVQRWAPLVMQVLRMLGQSAGLLPNVLRRMNQESGGNPRAINNWDSNAAKGTPSMGLMQTIGPTFNAYAGPFRGRGIWDPLANIYAGLNYAVNRYGSLQYAMDKPGGYKNGGWLKPGQIGVNETSKPEAVFTQDQLKALSRPNVTKNFNLHANVTNHPVDLVLEFRRMELAAGMS